MNCLEDVATCEVDGGCHLEGEVDVGLVGRDECMDDVADVTSCEEVSFELVATDLCETCLVCLNHGLYDDARRYFADTHQD